MFKGFLLGALLLVMVNNPLGAGDNAKIVEARQYIVYAVNNLPPQQAILVIGMAMDADPDTILAAMNDEEVYTLVEKLLDIVLPPAAPSNQPSTTTAEKHQRWNQA